MTYLLDTQVIIWALENNPQLPKAVEQIIDDSDHTIFITIVSLWEIAIKRSIGKLDLNYKLEDIQSQTTQRKVEILPITVAHLTAVEYLEFVGKHRDPFDRLIISQAIVEEMTLISSDPQFKNYPVELLW
jgi:PIN domain nuclease of toxin-antitoxin system